MDTNKARRDEISPTTPRENHAVVLTNTTNVNGNTLSDLSTSQPCQISKTNSVQDCVKGTRIGSTNTTADNRGPPSNEAATQPNKRVIFIDTKNRGAQSNDRSNQKCTKCGLNGHTADFCKQSVDNTTSTNQEKIDKTDIPKGNQKKKMDPKAKKTRCKTCGESHNSKNCVYNKHQKKVQTQTFIEKAKDFSLSTPQTQQPKVSMEGTGEKKDEPSTEKEPEEEDDNPFADINITEEWGQQIGFDYVDENHSLGFFDKIKNWWKGVPNVKRDRLPRSIMILCIKNIGHGRSTIHFQTYTTKVFESDLFRYWSVSLMDLDDLESLKLLRLAMIHFFFHDMRTFEKYLPLFRANEPYSASINNARPILDSKNLFTARHTPFLKYRRWAKNIIVALNTIDDLFFLWKLLKFIHKVFDGKIPNLQEFRDVFLGVVKYIAKAVLITMFVVGYLCPGDVEEKVLLNKQYSSDQLTLVSRFPRASVYIEEVIKIIPGAWRVIGILERFKYGHWRNYYWHRASMKYSFWKRLEIHKKTNEELRNVKIITETPWLNEINYFVDTDINVSYVGRTESYKQEVMIKPCRYPKIVDGNYWNAQLYRATSCGTAGTMHDKSNVQDLNEYEGYYPIFYNVGSFKKPANSFDNLLGAWHKRAVDIPNSSIYGINLHALTRITEALTICSVEINNDVEYKWVSTLKPIQRSRIEKVKEDRKLGVEDKDIAVSVKSDELLRSAAKMVPRLIFNVSGYWLEKFGVYAKELSAHFSQIYGPNHENAVRYKGIVFYPYYTCGATSSELSRFFKQSMDVEAYHLMVMGDDLHVYDGYQKRFVENDFSKYDRSQCYALQDQFIDWLEYNGYKDVAHDMMDMREATLKPKCRKINPIKIKPIPYGKDGHMEMMFTGQPFTSLQNSILNIITTIYVLSRSHVFNRHNPNEVKETQERYITTYELVGLTAKVLMPPYNRSTFLKGVFLEGIWVRLPSFLCKFGKIMTKPSTLSKKGNCLAQFLIAQWLGYGNMKNNWFYRTLHSLFWSIAMKNGFIGSVDDIDYNIHKTVIKDMEYAISSDDTAYVSDEVFNSFMYDRYGISVELMEDYCSFLRENHTLPMIYCHELILTLEKDY